MLKRLLYIIILILPFLIIIKPVVEGNIPFWNDPARDLLMAWDNLHKLSLIGPTSGIPGIFYGPHWIWLLSIGVAINKDPRFVVFLVLTLPYFIFLPLAILKLHEKKLVDCIGMITIWILSIFAMGSYANQIWSPNLAPLFFFGLLTLFYITPKATEKVRAVNFFTMGLIQGLLLQHQISFGVVLTVTWFMYFIYLFVREKKAALLLNMLSFWGGFTIMQIPFFLFEVRHGFMQIKSLLYTLSHNGPVVGQVGLTQSEIVQRFVDRGAGSLSLPQQIGIIMVILVVFFIFQNIKKKTIYSNHDTNLLLFICMTTLALFVVYFGTRNPVWDYHFIGVEIIFFFLIMLAVKKSRFLGTILFIWAIVLFMTNTVSFIRSFSTKIHTSELISKKETVQFILDDTKTAPFIYLAKNASIYTFDYDYLFRWVGEMEKRHPVQDQQMAKNVYLIIPDEMKSDKIGFTENRTPSTKYKTIKEWIRDDKTLIIKRVSL